MRSDTTQGLPSPFLTLKRSASKGERSSGGEEEDEVDDKVKEEEEVEVCPFPSTISFPSSPPSVASASSSKPAPSLREMPANPDLAAPALPDGASAPRNSAVPGNPPEGASEATVSPPWDASLKTLHFVSSEGEEKEARRRWEGGCGSRTRFFFVVVVDEGRGKGRG